MTVLVQKLFFILKRCFDWSLSVGWVKVTLEQIAEIQGGLFLSILYLVIRVPAELLLTVSLTINDLFKLILIVMIEGNINHDLYVFSVH